MPERSKVGSGLRAWAVASVLLAVPAAGLRAQDHDFQWQGALARGQFLEVRGISGDIQVTRASGSDARVKATKRGRERDFDAVHVVSFEEDGGVVVCAVYGEPRRPDSCKSDDLDRGDRHIRVSVDFEVQVPAGVELVAATVSGDVDARGLQSDVEASSVSGSVTVSTTGVARASTVSGELDIEMGSLDWDRLSFHTVSGDITLRVPEDLDAQVEFESLSGDFHTDFDMAMRQRRHRWVGSEVSGRIGQGSRDLAFKTVSGDVRLRRAPRS